MATSDELSKAQYDALANFRYQLRRFLRFSEDAARDADIEPRQHQLLLTIKGAGDEALSVGAIAERLQVRHHSAVELIARAEQRGLVERARGTRDRRQVFVSLTEAGEDVLRELAWAHLSELVSAGPDLIQALQRILSEGGPEAGDDTPGT